MSSKKTTSGRCQRRELHVPGGRQQLHRARCGGAAVALEQTLQRFQERQVSLGAGQALGTAPAREATGPATRRQLIEESVDQGGLAEARLTGDAQQQPTTGSRLLEAGAEGRRLMLPADGRATAGFGGPTSRSAGGSHRQLS